MHYLTLSWDDGFLKSSLKTADIFERYGLRTEFNVVATAHLAENDLPPDMQPGGRWGGIYGDFGLWNDLQARGHVIQPHGYKHANKSSLPFNDARGLILKCLDIFGNHLSGFEPAQTIFVFPYNVSTPELEAWLPGVVRAFRTGGASPINALPNPQTVKLSTCGWEEAEVWLDHSLNELLALPSGWLIYNVHGLDGEGWGPLRGEYLIQLLDTLVSRPDLRIMPARDILALVSRDPSRINQPYRAHDPNP